MRKNKTKPLWGWIASNLMTQDEFADKLGLTRVALNNYACGRSYPSVKTAIKLANLTGIPPDDLLGIARRGNTYYRRNPGDYK